MEERKRRPKRRGKKRVDIMEEGNRKNGEKGNWNREKGRVGERIGSAEGRAGSVIVRGMT